jgi:hypothetical protein
MRIDKTRVNPGFQLVHFGFRETAGGQLFSDKLYDSILHNYPLTATVNAIDAVSLSDGLSL